MWGVNLKMIRSISKGTNLLRLFIEEDIADVDHILNVQHYQQDDDRRGLIVDVKQHKIEGTTKILIDLKQGQPTVDQVYDSIYGIGKHCDIRVIIHTNGPNDRDNGISTADVWVVLNLIAQLQDKDVGILLCQYDEETSKVEYVDLYQNWCGPDSFTTTQIPSKEQFVCETFWSVYIYSNEDGYYNPTEAYMGYFRSTKNWGHCIRIDSEIDGEIKIFWNEKGVRYEIKQYDDSDEYLKKILELEMPKIKNIYGNDAVRFENVVGRLPRLYIKVSDTPFSWLYTATPKQITEFAKSMFSDAWGLRWQLEETANQLYEVESA